jgi:hypothetical protein
MPSVASISWKAQGIKGTLDEENDDGQRPNNLWFTENDTNDPTLKVMNNFHVLLSFIKYFISFAFSKRLYVTLSFHSLIYGQVVHVIILTEFYIYFKKSDKEK